MAKYVNGELVSEKTVGLSVNVFTKDDAIDEVTTGAHLGEVKLKDEGGDVFTGFSGYRPNSKLPIRFVIDDLGEPEKVEVPAEGTHAKPVEFDALALLDEPEKVDALSDEEKVFLGQVPLSMLRFIAIESHAHEGLTPLEDAAIAVLQHEETPAEEQVANTAPADGPLAGVMVALTVGSHEYYEDTAIAERKVCADGRILYKYSWVNIPLSVLDEP